jgi:hypothetical protein
MNKAKQIIKLTSNKGTTFAGIRGYTNQQGEVANYTIVTGFSYENAKAHDIACLENADWQAIADKTGFPLELVQLAGNELLASLHKPNAAISQGLIDAFRHVSNGVKLHIETRQLFITGLVVSKKTLVKGEYKPVKSQPKTLAKKAIKKCLDLKTDKIRQFSLDLGQYKLKGQTI